MAAACRAVLQFWALVSSASAVGLSVLPADIAEQASVAAQSYAWYAANSRWGLDGDAAGDQLRAEQAIDEMKKLGAGLLTDSTVEDFKEVASFSGWNAANERYGYYGDASRDAARVDEHVDRLLGSGLTDGLVTNLRKMCFHASWSAANDRGRCCPEDLKKDTTYFEHYSKLIGGDVVLLSMRFQEQGANVVGHRPQVVGEQLVDNSKSDIEQSATFAFWYTEGHTDSWSNAVGFKVGVTEKMKVGFTGIGSAGLDLSFEASFQHSWTSGKSQGVTKRYSYPLVVPAHKIYQAKATVHQGTMEVPYEFTLAIGGHTWTSSGIWRGVAVSVSTYTVTDITPNSTSWGVTVINATNASQNLI